MRGEPEAGEAAESQEPWAMEALAILARRLAPAPSTQGGPRTLIIETPPRLEPSWLDAIIEERMKS
jgi:hypothetical protein